MSTREKQKENTAPDLDTTTNVDIMGVKEQSRRRLEK